MKRIIVIGAGIIGSAIALHLQRAGADVTVLDTELVTGGIATPKSWAWINASWGNDKDYVALRMRSMEAWRELDKTVAGLAVNWCGSLLWDLPEDKLRAFCAEHKSWGYPARLVSKAEAAKIEPALPNPPELAVHVAIEGAVDPVHAVQKCLASAQAEGATVVTGAHVRYLNEEGGRITGVTTTEESLSADEVVIAAGLGSVGILKSVGIALALEQPAGLLVHSKPMPEILNGLVLSPRLHVRQSSEGRLIAGSDFGGSDPGDDPEATAEALFAAVEDLFGKPAGLQMEHYTTGNRPALPDGIPAIGRPRQMPGLYLAVMHSGVTLAPVIGETTADELLHGKRDESLARYHPDRVLS